VTKELQINLMIGVADQQHLQDIQAEHYTQVSETDKKINKNFAQ